MSKEKNTQEAEGPRELAARMKEKHSYAVPIKDLATCMVVMRDMGRDFIEVIAALETDAVVIDSLAEQLAAAKAALVHLLGTERRADEMIQRVRDRKGDE
jgi:hypothetical protein